MGPQKSTTVCVNRQSNTVHWRGREAIIGVRVVSWYLKQVMQWWTVNIAVLRSPKSQNFVWILVNNDCGLT